MLVRNEFPKPDNQLKVLKRYLHVLALIQNDKDPIDWNSRTLSEKLYKDEMGEAISDKMIRDYLKTNLKNDLGIDIDSIKGGRRTSLKKGISKELLPSLLSIYSLFVSSDVSRENIIKRYIKAHGNESLWIFAKIYFAAIEGFAVSFEYDSRSEKKVKRYTVKPYHIVFRGNNLYLACGNMETGKDVLFIFSKIKPCSLKVMEQKFDVTHTPSIDELFSKSLGAFIGKKQKVVLRYTNNVSHYITDIIDCVDPKIKPIKGAGDFTFEASFEIADDIYLCKQLFSCGREAEIVSPESLRKKMGEMLRESLSLY